MPADDARRRERRRRDRDVTYVIMGATGNVGSAAADFLLERGEAVTIVTRDAAAADEWVRRGAEVAEADIADPASLRAAFRRGRRAFVLNPPGDPSGDFDAVKHESIARILEALDGSGLEKIVVASTYGVQPGERLGDLGTLWRLEEGVRAQSIPAAINRGAYYMSNWAGMLEPAREGTLPSMYPPDLAIPMVAPVDLGDAAAQRLTSGVDDVGVVDVEGPERYTAADVAAAFSRALGRPVEVAVTPPEAFEEVYLGLGFSAPSAASFANMTRLSVEGGFDLPEHPRRGRVDLETFIRELVDGV